MTLISKLQYKDFEPGEFTGRQARTLEDTLTLIHEFPWNDQRDHLVIGLTNPAVTIEGPNHDFLKLSPFYNGKFVLHYFDPSKHLYTHSFEKLPDADPIIRSFFDSQSFDPAGFKKEITWLQSNLIHFQSQEFLYPFQPKYLFWPVLGVIGGTIWLLFFALSLSQLLPAGKWIALALLFLLIPIAFWAALIVNHYRYAKDKLLILSRGQDKFSFGNANAPVSYYKKDIREITTYGRRGRGGYPSVTRVNIIFNDGRSIDISCTMIQYDVLMSKFPHCKTSIRRETFPFL